MRIIIFDTDILSMFAKAKALDVLFNLLKNFKLCITSRIKEELSAPLEYGYSFPLDHMWIDYDKEADVLSLSFRKPQRATKTIETDDILIRKDGHKIVGITILNASSR